jgi:hypothetical protein
MRETATINEVIGSMKNKFTYSTMNNVSNDNNSSNKMSSDLAEFKAQKLVEKYNAPQSRNFFLKCIYHLSESDIQEAIEMSMKPWVKSPIKYFVRVCCSKFDS